MKLLFPSSCFFVCGEDGYDFVFHFCFGEIPKSLTIYSTVTLSGLDLVLNQTKQVIVRGPLNQDEEDCGMNRGYTCVEVGLST